MGRTTNQLTKKDFRQIVLCIAERFRRFAVRLDCFKLLPFSDQRELLMKNITLYVQYVLAQYFAAKDAAEQGAYSVLSRDFNTLTREDLHSNDLYFFWHSFEFRAPRNYGMRGCCKFSDALPRKAKRSEYRTI